MDEGRFRPRNLAIVGLFGIGTLFGAGYLHNLFSDAIDSELKRVKPLVEQVRQKAAGNDGYFSFDEQKFQH